MRKELERIQDIENYLMNRMSSEEKAAFESSMSGDEKLSQQVEVQKEITKSIQIIGASVLAKTSYAKYKMKLLITKIVIGLVVLGVLIGGSLWAAPYLFGEGPANDNKTEIQEETASEHESEAGHHSGFEEGMHGDDLIEDVPMADTVSNEDLRLSEDAEVEESDVIDIDASSGNVTGNNGQFSITSSDNESSFQALKIASSFNPHGGGQLDYWTFNVSGTKKFSIKIFNEYAREVYSSTNTKFKWYGKDKDGTDLPAGDYSYTVEMTFQNDSRSVYDGIVTLLWTNDEDILKQ